MRDGSVAACIAALVLGACSASTERPADDAAPAPDAAMCVDPAVAISPDQRACTTTADCAIAEHQLDCCGTLAVHGIRRDQLATFEAAEGACRARFPACGCDSGQVTADDGAAAPLGSGSTAIVVACEVSVCTTHVRAPTDCAGQTCSPTQVCIDSCTGNDAGPGTDMRCFDVVPACVNATSCACLGANDPCRLAGCASVDQGRPYCAFC